MPSDPEKTKKVAEALARLWVGKASVDEVADEIVNSIFEGMEYKPKNPTPRKGSGFVRGGVPKHVEVVPLSGFTAAPVGFLSNLPISGAAIPLTNGHSMTQAQSARQQGFTGQVCGHCGSFNTRQNGHCLLCTDCHQSSGCS